jgi:capsular exopolysaccharide synthesis family protein
VGLFAGAGFIVFRDRSDRSIHEPGDSPFYLALPELGIIPSTKFDGGRSAVAESFRSTLVSIFFATGGKARPKVLVIASAGSGEGKSMIVSNLAIAMAEMEQRVLVIDADLRCPRQHEIFLLSNERGLGSILLEKTVLNGDRLLGGLIQESEIKGLFVLTSGPGPVAATSLLYRDHMRELLNYVRKQFDVVLIDTPPMLQIPDARVVARLADAALIVIRAGKTTRDAALAARKRFDEDGSTVLGTIFNDWNPRFSATGYYGYRDSRYRHSSQVGRAIK